MRSIANLGDAAVVLKQHDDVLDKLKNKDIDMQLRKISNLGDGLNPQDAISLKQLQQLRKEILDVFKLNNLQVPRS